MDELIHAVSAKTGLSAEQAKGAAAAVIQFIKEKVPVVGGPIEQFLSGGAGGLNLGDVAKNIGGMFSGKKE